MKLGLTAPAAMGWRDYDRARALAYDAERAAPDAHVVQVRDVLVRELATVPRSLVLDLGAGTGLWSERLARWLTVSVVAVEPSTAMLGALADKRGSAGSDGPEGQPNPLTRKWLLAYGVGRGRCVQGPGRPDEARHPR